MNLGGLSAAYGGFQQAENTQATTEQNQAAAKEAAFKLLGAQVLGRALTGGMQPQGPQPPAPGQPSVPAAPPPQSFQQAPPQGSPAAVPAPRPAAGPAGAPPAQGGSGLPEMSLQALTAQIMRTSPGVRNHPEVLLAALERASPILDRQSREDLADMRKQMATERLKQTGELAQARIEAVKAAEAGRQGRFDVNQARLASNAAVRQDQGYQRLEMQKQDLERKIQQGGDKQDLSRWRAIVDAQHKRAVEVIQSSNINTNMPKAERDALLAEQRTAYDAEIAAMRGKVGSTTPTGGVTPPGAPVAPKVQGQVPQNAPVVTAPAPPAARQPPPAAMLKPGGINVIDGVGWRLVNGQPVEVPLPPGQ